MKRNFFNDPQPANQSEIVEAIDEKGVGSDEVYADIVSPQDDNVGTEWEGWTAEIHANDPEEFGDWEIGTLGFASREALEAALTGAGISAESIDVVE